MPVKKLWSFIAGFILLFFVYHFPEFFDSFVLTATFKIGFLVAAIALGYFQGWKGLAGYGLSFNNKWYLSLLAGLVFGLLAFCLSIFISIQCNFERLISIQSFQAFISALPMALLMTFFPSIAEDILTRGYLFGHIKTLKPGRWILLSAIIYVLNHIWRLNDGAAVLSYLFLLGLVLAICVMAQKSLWLALGIHWGSNIAFTLSGSEVQLASVGSNQNATWALALTWAIVLLIAVSWYLGKVKIEQVKTR